MNTTFCAMAAALPLLRQFWQSLERWLLKYLTWRLQRVVAAQFWSLSDRALKDSGFTQAETTRVIRSDATRNRRFVGVGH
jgi:uncharacterized protein YjiS (DUF1127 family)